MPQKPISEIWNRLEMGFPLSVVVSYEILLAKSRLVLNMGHDGPRCGALRYMTTLRENTRLDDGKR